MSQAVMPKSYVQARGLRMAYHTRGSGDPILFLHGNPTSSFVWRNVLPALEGHGRLIAVDLIGMGDSDKLPAPSGGAYTLAAHREFLWSFIDQIVAPHEKILLVGHDWGAVLAFDWAHHHPSRVRGIAYFETIVRPFAPDESGSELTATLARLRSPEGDALILDENLFVEGILPSLVQRRLSAEEMDEYRRPFARPEDRWATLDWPRQIPIGGDPAEACQIVESYSRWMSSNALPKLFINAEPGAILTGVSRDFCRRWHNQDEVTVCGLHYLHEDSAAEIGHAIATWDAKLRTRTRDPAC